MDRYGLATHRIARRLAVLLALLTAGAGWGCATSGEGWRDHYWEPNPRSWGRHPPVVREWQGALLWPMQGGFLEFLDFCEEFFA